MGANDGVKLVEVRVSKVIARPRSEGVWHPVGPPPPHGDDRSGAAAAPLAGQAEADTYATSQVNSSIGSSSRRWAVPAHPRSSLAPRRRTP